MRHLFQIAAMATAFALPAYAAPHDVQGVWLTEDGGSKIIIEDCGDGTPCGRIAWINPDNVVPENQGAILLDANNPDLALRDQTLIGLVILDGFRRGGKRWKRGNIYDPESGKSYGSGIKLDEDGTLRVKGCIGPLCQTQTWTPTTFTE